MTSGWEGPMKILRFLTLCFALVLCGCASQWVFLTESGGTGYYLDARSPQRYSETVWEVRERFFNKTTQRWYLEAEARYDCQEKTFMTVLLRGFSEHRPLARPEMIQGNVPVTVSPDSPEEARLQAICAIVEGGEGS